MDEPAQPSSHTGPGRGHMSAFSHSQKQKPAASVAKPAAGFVTETMRYTQPEHGELQQQPGTSTAEQGKQDESGAPETTAVKD